MVGRRGSGGEERGGGEVRRSGEEERGGEVVGSQTTLCRNLGGGGVFSKGAY